MVISTICPLFFQISELFDRFVGHFRFRELREKQLRTGKDTKQFNKNLIKLSNVNKTNKIKYSFSPSKDVYKSG